MNDIDKINQRINENSEIHEATHEIINCKLNKLESQLCMAKKRIDELEERLKTHINEPCHCIRERKIDDFEERIKAIEDRQDVLHDKIEANVLSSVEPKDSKSEQKYPNIPCTGCYTTPCECDPKREPWKPKKGEMFFYISDDFNDIYKQIWKFELSDEDLNCFRTREQAEKFLERIKEIRREVE